MPCLWFSGPDTPSLGSLCDETGCGEHTSGSRRERERRERTRHLSIYPQRPQSEYPFSCFDLSLTWNRTTSSPLPSPQTANGLSPDPKTARSSSGTSPTAKRNLCSRATKTVSSRSIWRGAGSIWPVDLETAWRGSGSMSRLNSAPEKNCVCSG